MTRSAPEPALATRHVRRAANGVGAAAVAWLVLFWVSSETGLRAQSPWADDPADLVVSLVYLLLVVVGVVTFVRVQRDARSSVMPAGTADDVIRGLVVAVGAVAAADGAMLAALLSRPAEGGAANPVPALLIGLLVLSIATTAAAGASVWWAARATREWRATAPVGGRDALDDFVAWLRELSVSPVPRRFGAAHLASVADWLAAFLESRLSPRRSPWLFAVLVAVGFGTSFAVWHMIVEGAPPSLSTALLPLAVFSAFGAMAVLAGWALFGGYLRLIRHAS